MNHDDSDSIIGDSIVMTNRVPFAVRNAIIASPLLLLFALFSNADDKPSSIYGRWEIAKMIDADGRRQPDLFLSFSIEKGPVAPLLSMEKEGYLLRIADEKSPAKITMYRISDNRRVVYYHGIYKFLGDTLVIALSTRETPKSFEPKGDDDFFVIYMLKTK